MKIGVKLSNIHRLYLFPGIRQKLPPKKLPNDLSEPLSRDVIDRKKLIDPALYLDFLDQLDQDDPFFYLNLGMTREVYCANLAHVHQRSCQTYREARRCAVAHIHPHVGLASQKFEEKDHELRISRIAKSMAYENVHDSELWMGIKLGFLTECTGTRPQALAIRFKSSKPAEKKILAYQAFFECPVYFDAECDQIILSRDVLDRPFVTADPLLHRLLGESAIAESQIPQSVSSLAARVSKEIENHLCSSTLSMDFVANRLGYSGRSLRRKLSEDGFSYETLLSDVRRKKTLSLLAKGNAQTKQLTHLLGFNSQGAFINAFKIWFGMPPHKFQKEHRHLSLELS